VCLVCLVFGMFGVWLWSCVHDLRAIVGLCEMILKKFLVLLVIFCIISSSLLVRGEEDDDSESTIKHPAKNVVERKLVVEKVNTKIILRENKNYASDTKQKNFKGDTLAYVTPWYVMWCGDVVMW
jgi:hypothetical protein